MKPKEFAAVLRAFADVLGAARAADAKDAVVSFASIFEADPAASVAKAVERLGNLPASGPTGAATLGDVALLLAPLRQMLDPIAKAAVLADLDAAGALLRERRSTGLDAFAAAARASPPAARPKAGKAAAGAAPRADLVEQYRQKLEANLGQETVFLALYEELRADKQMGAGEVAALAKLMVGSAPKGKAAGLKKIFSLHQALMTFKAKDRATGGRSAA